MRAAWRRLWAGAWALLRRRQWERDLQAEVESMAALAAEAQPRRGRVAMAGSEAAREWTRASGWEYWAANFARDVGYGARGLRRTPATTAVIVLTLALGIGGSCLAFAWVYAGTLRPLPFAQSQRLVWVSSAARGVASAGMSGPVLRDGQARLNAIFDEYALFRGEGDTTWRVGSAAWEASTRKVDGRFFGLLGVHALAGRLLSPSDAAAGHGAVVVLSYDFWRRHFGGNLAVLGRSMNEWEGDYPSYTIVGVLPPSFE
ncbi:MAG: ABC transporter permease, partial [Terriglobales bacterium]